MKERLTDRYMETLEAPAKGNIVIWDESKNTPAGFGVRITANGTVSFILDYRNARRESRRFTIGQWNEWKVFKARERARELRVEIDKGGDPVQERRDKREKLAAEPTIADLAKRYYDKHVMQKNGEDQQRNVRDILKNYVVKEWGDRKLRDVGEAQVRNLHGSFVADPDETKRHPYRANRVLSTISKMFNWGIENGLCAENPAKGVKKHTEGKGGKWLSEERLRAIDDAITDYGEDAGELIRLIMLTGYRSKEWKRARKDAFDMDHGTWTKQPHTVKNREWQAVKLSPVVMGVLRRVMASTPASEPFLFPGRVAAGKLAGKPKPRTTIRRAWVQILRNAGLAEEFTVTGKRGKPLKRYKPKIRIHDLRHSYASWLAEHGVPLVTIGKSIGHVDPKTTARYSHIADASALNAQDMFSKMVTQRVQ